MAIKISGIPNAGTIIVEGAASEATLQQLLAAMNKNAKSPTGSEGNIPNIGAEGTKAVERIKKAGELTGQAVSGTAELFNKAMSNTTPTVKDMNAMLARYTPTEAGAKVIETFGGVVGDNIEIFRTLSTSGIDLGDSILQAQIAAADARLPLDIFGKTVKENSQSLAMGFGTATQGAAKFAEVQGKFMATSGQKFAALGFSMDELASYNASYMEQQQRAGRLSKMSTDEIVAGQERYNQELDRLSKATGISRQQIDEANKASQRDARMKLALGKLDADQQAAVNAKIKQLEQLDPTGKMAAGFKDLIAGGGVALTAEARQFTLSMQSAGVDASKMGRDIFNGSKDAVDNMNAGFSRAAKASEAITEGERRTGAAMATMGQFTPMLGKAVLQGMGDTQKAAAMAKEEQAKRLEAVKTQPTRGAAGLDQTLTEVQNSFKRSLIESKVLDATANAMSYATDKTVALADEFAKMTSTEKFAAVFGIEFGKALASAMATYYGGKALYKYGEGVQSRADAKLEKEKISKMDPVEREKYLAEKAKIEAERKEIQAAEKAAKGGLAERGIQMLKSAGGKVLALVAVGGAIYAAWKYDLVGSVLEEGAGGSGVKPESERLTIDEQRERDKAKTPGAEIPKAAQPEAPKPPDATKTNQPSPVSKMNDEVNALKTALKDVDYSKLMFPEAVGTSIDAGVIKLKNLREEITTTTSAFKDLGNVNLQNLNSSINKLSEAVKESTQPKEGTKVADNANFGDANKQVVELLTQLNNNMGNLANMQGDAVDYLSKTAKYTRQASNNIV